MTTVRMVLIVTMKTGVEQMFGDVKYEYVTRNGELVLEITSDEQCLIEHLKKSDISEIVELPYGGGGFAIEPEDSN